MSKIWKFSGIAAAMILAGCGGSSSNGGSGNTTSVTPTSGNSGPDTVVIADAGGGNYDVTVNGVTTRYATSPAGEQTIGGFTRFSDVAGAPGVIGYHDKNGQTYAGVSMTTASSPVNQYAGAEFGRSANSEIPTTGTATFTGNYVGLWVNDADGSASFVFDGDVDMTANFGASTVTGTISDRDVYAANTGALNAGSLNDLVLSGTINGTGGFSGTATGGEASGVGTTTTSNGIIAGLFGGTNGSQVAGGLTIDHDAGGGFTFTEVGAFTGN